MGLLKQALVIALVLGLLSLLIFVGVGLPSETALEPLYEPPYYIAIIEASTEDSKVYAYKFDHTPEDGLILQDTHYVKVKPGLFAFADTPSEADAGVVSLVAHADTFIPAAKRQFSPLLLRAPLILTEKEDNQGEGGPEDDEDSSEKYPKSSATTGPTPLLLRAARGALFRSGYAVPGLESAAVLEPQMRSLYSWYAANYLIGNFKWDNTSEATIDIDWESMKITYEPNEEELEQLDPQDVFEVPFGGKSKRIFSKSFMNLGVMDLRYAIFKSENDMNLTMVNSSCINPEIEEEDWTYNDISYKISGVVPGLLNEFGRPSVDLEKCEYLVEQPNLLGEPDKMPHRLAGLLRQSLLVTGITHRRKEPDPDGLDNVISGVRFHELAREQCSASPGGAEQSGPFMCLDLLLIRQLLQQALGYDDDQQLLVLQNIAGNDITWALGFAHSQLTKFVLISALNQ